MRYSQCYYENNNNITVDVATAANTAAEFQRQMMDRFKFMEEQQVFINNILAWVYSNVHINNDIELLEQYSYNEYEPKVLSATT